MLHLDQILLVGWLQSGTQMCVTGTGRGLHGYPASTLTPVHKVWSVAPELDSYFQSHHLFLSGVEPDTT